MIFSQKKTHFISFLLVLLIVGVGNQWLYHLPAAKMPVWQKSRSLDALIQQFDDYWGRAKNFQIEKILDLIYEKKEGLKADHYLKIGDYYIWIGHYKKALRDYRKAHQLDPENSSVFVKLGIANHYLGNQRTAENQFEEALKGELTGEELGIIGNFFYDRGDKEKAMSLYRKALKLGQDVPWLYGQMGFYYKTIGNYTQAIKMFQKTLDEYFALWWADEQINEIR